MLFTNDSKRWGRTGHKCIVYGLVSVLGFVCSPLAWGATHTTLSHGARLYVEYCAGCHSLKYVQRETLAAKFALPQHANPGRMLANLDTKQAQRWFQQMPPDLSLVANTRGPTWLYRYLTRFYQDLSRPYGANNLMLPNTAMPNVLAPLQGEVVKVIYPSPHLILVKNGEQSAQEFAQTVHDIVEFLTYIADPNQVQRHRIGVWVLGWVMGALLLVLFLRKHFIKSM